MPSAPLQPIDLSHCLLQDRQALGRRLHGLRQRQKKGLPFDQGLARLQRDLQRSQAAFAARQGALGPICYPEELPISARREEIAGLIQRHQVIILCGETGSGKSTQLPKICLELGYGIGGRIGHTQPRRIAARSLASRIASELDTELGAAVGYKVRFKDQVSAQSRVKLVTDGMLLAEIQQDRELLEYDCLIIDEAHERSLNIDFLLGYLKQLLPKRPELKLIVTSATIDPERFARFFDGAPVINVSGRTYPVDLRYRPPSEEGGSNERDEPLQQALLDAVDELAREPWGDILVFLSGERAIRESAESLRQHRHKGIQILPLYARQSSAEQAAIFRPDGSRRIILATNVAETSLTVPGIRNVIDAGFARISRYSHRSKVQRLPVERIAQASANQRQGRCGRVAPGICIRLYSEEDFASRAEFTEPEIQRTNLASVILQMKMLGFGDIAAFPFIDPPDMRLVRDGYRVLEELGALDGTGRVSRIGQQIARLPVDPRIGRMVLESVHHACLREVLVIAAALSVQDPRERPADKQQQADEAHALFKDETSDFLSFVKLWDYLQEKRRHLSRRKFQQLCQGHFLSANRVNEWIDIHQQLQLQMHELGHKENEQPGNPGEIHRALLSGLLGHIGWRESGKNKGYLGARNSRFHLFPGSGLFASQPKWLMAAELVETSRLYARTAAAIEPAWVEQAAGHLLQRSHSQPHWQSQRGQVGGFEKVSLYGLVLVPRRRINYGPINPAQSREIFIRSALVEGDFHSRAPFWRHNQELIAQVHELEAKSRRRDILVDEDKLFAFYNERIPEGIYSTAQFDQWLREISKQQPKLLHLRMGDILREQAPQLDAAAFPNRLDFAGLQLPLRYAFEPGQADDGANLAVPLAVLNQVDQQQIDWGIPGQLQERLTALLKALPKTLRKHFVPVPDTAARLAERLKPGAGPLLTRLGEELKRLSGVRIPEDAWDLQAVPEHLRLNIRVLDENGQLLAQGRDLAALKRQFAERAEQAFSQVKGALQEQTGLRDWSCGPLPESIEIGQAGVRLKGFPALVDEGKSVALRVLDSAARAEQAHRQGLRRLFLIRLGQSGRYLKKNLPNLQRMALQYAKARAMDGQPRELQEELVELIIDLAFIQERPAMRDAQAFNQALESGRSGLMEQANRVCTLASEILHHYQGLRQALAGRGEINWLDSLNDMRAQLDRLVYRGFLLDTPFQQLRQYPRYLKALQLRLDKLGHAAARDQQLLRQIGPALSEWQGQYDKACHAGREDERLEQLRWMFEELRVSLFAQELGTAYPISLKRMEKRRRELGL
ncbi:ATP-dependent RNA helicase HrpA [Magnetovirga frankeli]|uniref:ATP-dependent RNA helicase HrpA n=1 Tax=Magnetovirga frankeli TaxID=947516 RepID=UPI003D347D54